MLDTSAILAWLHDETGADKVDAVISTATMSTVNWSELAQKLTQNGADAERTCNRLRTLGVAVEPFTAEDALLAGELWARTSPDCPWEIGPASRWPSGSTSRFSQRTKRGETLTPERPSNCCAERTSRFVISLRSTCQPAPGDWWFTGRPLGPADPRAATGRRAE
ncbi:PIN domain-containing protein [Saccharopolyspora kobensis]|uniref:PIN domain-containing protein n=1 Tax=Saccharopolyspora kobensis TaxID=146035 RepID=UPI001F165001|nr:PIN domain-containing protein [Saccharopolyspora kobensis]